MKNQSLFTKVSWIIIAVLGLSFLASCDSKDDEPAPAPVASFQFEVSETNGLEVTFTNFSKDATAYSWNFGDGVGTSTDENPTYTYADGGTFTVTLTATNETGSAEHTKEVAAVNTLKPTADFSFQVSSENTLEVSFTSNSPNATGFQWDFGDGAGTSTEANPTYTYATGGSYSVSLSVSNEYGTSNSTKEVTVVNPTAVNLIQNGEFNDDSVWEVLQHNINEAGTVSIENGQAIFNKGIQAGWGSEPHIDINQAVVVEAGNYQFDMNITTNGISEVWFEVWVGSVAPEAGDDYNGDDGASAVLVFNTWDCPDNSTYSGPMAPESCQDTDGSVTLDAGTWYVVIRSGGLNFAEDGIVIDNVTMYKVD
jgi:PKD repeat protein